MTGLRRFAIMVAGILDVFISPFAAQRISWSSI